jgi:hypothetical protein
MPTMPPKRSTAEFLAAVIELCQKSDPGALEDMVDVIGDPSAQWRNAQGRVPARQSIGTGPTEAMSGSGARRMTRDYYDPMLQERPQIGLSAQYADFDGVMFPDSDDSYLNKARDFLTAARRATVKADIADAMQETDDKEAKSDHSNAIDEALKLLGRAKKMLAAATDEGLETDRFPDATKALVDRLKLLASKITKTRDTSAGATHAATGSGGLTVTASISDLLATVSGRPPMQKSDTTGLSMPPDMSPTRSAVLSIADEIERAENAGDITGEEATTAMSLLQRRNLCQAGKLDQSVFLDALIKSKSSVQKLFGCRYESNGKFVTA